MKRFTYFLLVTFLLAACSTSKPKTEEATDTSAEANQSAADQVGSTPEDLLSEEKGDEGGANADPFADVKQDESAATPEATTEAPTENQLATDVDTKSTDETLYGTTGDAQTESTGATDIYTVKAGDTLMKIAFTIYGDLSRWHDLYTWNQAKLGSANELKRGTKLEYQVPAVTAERELHSHSYKIKKGDTLAGIADEVYGRRTKYKKLQRYNPKLIKNPNRIFAGFTIFYEITPQEMAEAEARRRERMSAAAPTPTPPSPENTPAAQANIPNTPQVPEEPNPPPAETHSVPAPAATSQPMIPSDAPVPPTMPQ